MGKTILLVDDEMDILDIQKRYLVQAGYQVLVARDGVEGLDLFKLVIYLGSYYYSLFSMASINGPVMVRK